MGRFRYLVDRGSDLDWYTAQGNADRREGSLQADPGGNAVKPAVKVFGCFAIGIVVSLCAVYAQTIQIQSFQGNGRLAWSNAVPTAVHKIEWASSAGGPWTDSWGVLAYLTPQDGLFSTSSVPMFYRVAANPYRRFPEADATVWNSDPTVNMGKYEDLVVRNQPVGLAISRAFLRFNLQGLTGVVTSAVLRLTMSYLDSLPNTHTAAFVSNDSWVETNITWNTQPTLGAVIGSWSVPLADVGATVDIDVTAKAIEAANGDKKLSVVLYSDGTGGYFYGARESSEPRWRPLLIINGQ